MFKKPRPKPKRELAIRITIPSTRRIYLEATWDAIEEIKRGSFGILTPDDSRPNHFRLEVSAMYDFDEVLEYLQSFED